MKHTRYIIIMMLIVSMSLLSGCDDNSKRSSGQVGTEITESGQKQEKATNEINHSKENAGDDTMIPPSIVDIPIYSLDADSKETTATTVSVPENTEITPELIVQFVVDDLVDKSYKITVDTVAKEEDNIVVDFSKSTPLLKKSDEKIETSILDAIAQSLLDNISDCEGVIFRVDHKEYKSSNFSFGFSEVYLSR